MCNFFWSFISVVDGDPEERLSFCAKPSLDQFALTSAAALDNNHMADANA